MANHFEDLWEQCEKIHSEFLNDTSVDSIIDELYLKINIYKVLSSKKEISGEDMEKIKSRTFGEILLTLTNLSLKDNINVYAALLSALQFRSAEKFLDKHQK